jgi:hypothetical protein
MILLVEKHPPTNARESAEASVLKKRDREEPRSAFLEDLLR